jgi:mpaB/rubber oxygenase-like protein
MRNRPNKRLVETCQMVIDVLSPEGFGPRGRAIRTLQKVRLMHAAIRLLVRKSPRHIWIPDFGQPVNQEDLAGNLMALSWIVIDGMRRLGIAEASDTAKAEAYLDAWREVGRFLGIRPELIPDNLEQAEQLTRTIQRRQLDPSSESREMTAALLNMMKENSLPGMEGLPAALMRFFLADDIADRLGIPRDDLEDNIVRAMALLNGEVDRVIEKIPARLLVFRHLGLSMIQWMLDLERDGKVTTFSIPQNLSENWGLAPASEHETLWDHLIHDFLKRRG